MTKRLEAVRLAIRHDLNWTYLRCSGTVVVAGLPLALIAGQGLVKALGIIYAVAWALVMVPSITASMAMLFDAFLIILGRWPLFLPAAWISAKRHPKHDDRMAMQVIHLLSRVSFWANPLSNLTLAALIGATRLRPTIRKQLVEFFQKQLQREEPHVTVAMEYATPVIEHVPEFERELQLAGSC